MCGIAGAISLSPDARPDVERVRRLSACIAHRGPDADGLWLAPSGRACLAHRRLSIIDLEAGAQPMSVADGSAAITFNGEIYNYQELRRALLGAGVSLGTHSDTEVLLQLLKRNEASALDSLRGMFAFAYWDDQRGCLILARDRLGKKPLFYCDIEGCLYFASSLHALHTIAAYPTPINLEALDSYLTLGYIPAPLTIYRGISKLPAATVLQVDSSGNRQELRFWDLSACDTPFQGTFADALDQLAGLLNDAVALRLRSDVPLGVFLSGGIDSSLVAALASRQSPGLQTFSIAMDAAAYDESSYAAEVALRLGTTHHCFRAVPDLLGLLPDIVTHFGEPYADSSALPTWLLARETRQHVTVALGGDGGDETFAGYNWYLTAARLARISGRLPLGLFAAAESAMTRLSTLSPSIANRVGRSRRALAMLATPVGSQRFAALRSQLTPSDAAMLYAGQLADMRARGQSIGNARLVHEYERSSGSDLRRMRWTDISTYLADELLPKVDVMTMAHGLEARSPLLDQDVVRFALSMPDEWLWGPSGGKALLRSLLGRYLPPELFDRPKQGFSIPLSHWLARGTGGHLERMVTSDRLLDSGWFERDGLRALVEEHERGRRDHGARLFSLIVLDEWLRQR